MGEKIKQPDKSAASTGFRSLFNRRFFMGKVLFIGLAAAQIIATIHVYLSNIELFHSIESIKNTGYLAVPNHIVMNSLLEFGPAFYGGLFFTLSAGALLSLLGFISAFIWDRLLKRKITFLIPFLILWAGLIGEVNIKGFCPFITAYFLFIPSIVFLTTSRYMPPAHNKNTGYKAKIMTVIPILLIVTIAWTLRFDSGIYTDIRDHLLLSSNLGTKVNDFYYRYTLYPAEAIKSLNQKIINTYRFDNRVDNILADKIKKELINYDFLEAGGNTALALAIDKQNNSLIFSNKGKVILTTSTEAFLMDTEKTIREISMQTDRQDFFRRFTFISLFTGFPAVIIIFFYSILGFILNLFLDYRGASTVSLFSCLAVTVLLSAFLHNISGKRIEEEDLSDTLNSGSRHEQVMALKIIDENKMDVSQFGNYHEMLSNPYIPVRYWLARALGRSHDMESHNALLILMDDPCPNVACMAYYSLGQRGEKSTVNEIIKRIQLSDHWYEQWYAYKALRALGWKQTISK